MEEFSRPFLKRRVRPHARDVEKDGGEEEKMELIGRGRFTGLNSWAPAASAILRKERGKKKQPSTE